MSAAEVTSELGEAPERASPDWHVEPADPCAEEVARLAVPVRPGMLTWQSGPRVAIEGHDEHCA
jgi:hypothetical protein